MTIAKPVMRGALMSQIKKNMVVAGIVSTGVSAAWWWFVCRDRKLAYESFHKNLDVDKMFARQKAAGVFKSLNDLEEKMNEK